MARDVTHHGKLLHALLAVPLLAGGLLLAACSTDPKPLNKDEIETRVQGYYTRGTEQFNRGEFRLALESLRTANAYDSANSYPQVDEMIEKAEAKLRIPSGQSTAVAKAPAPSGPPPPAPQPPAAPRGAEPPPSQKPPAPAAPKPTAPPTTAPQPRLDIPVKTYRSAVYPYAMEIPEDWSLGPVQPEIAGIPIEVLAAPGAGPVPTDIGTLAAPLAPDVDGRAFYESMRKGLRSIGIDPVEVGKRQVDGAEARLLKASVADHQGKHTSTMVMFEAERVGWLIMFSTTPEQSDRLQPLFHRMLDSFRIGKQSRVI